MPPEVGRDRNGVDIDTAEYLGQSNRPMMFILHSNLVPVAKRSPNEHGEVLDDRGGVIGRLEIVPSSSLTSQTLSSPNSDPNITHYMGRLDNASTGSLSFAGRKDSGLKTLPYRSILAGDSGELEGREPNENGHVYDEYGDIIGRVEVVRGLVLVIQPKNPVLAKQTGHIRRSGKLPPRKSHGQEVFKRTQCWDHGCNGLNFLTYNSLLRHRRRKDGTSTKETCPRCGATFTQVTALQHHVTYGRCKFSQSNSGYDQNYPDALRKAEIKDSQIQASWPITASSWDLGYDGLDDYDLWHSQNDSIYRGMMTP